jgi:RHS repeat-associated protein
MFRLNSRVFPSGYSFSFLRSECGSANRRLDNCLSKRSFGSALMILSLLGVNPLVAQNTTGLPPFSTVHEGTYDSVKINDGAVMISLPVWTKPGLIPFSYSLVFNNAVGQNSAFNVSIPTVWSPQTSAGLTPGLQFTATIQNVPCPNPQNRTNKETGFKILESNGTSHFVSGMQWDSAGCFPEILSGSTNDGSGLSLSIGSNGAGVTISDRNGNIFSGTLTHPTLLTDPNGNQLSFAGALGTTNCGGTQTLTTTYTDTTGLVPMTETVTCTNGVATQDVHSWTDIGGNPQSLTINYSHYTQQTAFGCFVPGDIGPNSVYLPSSITAPEGTFTITYEATPGVPTNVTGRISKVVFPSGASVQYSFSGGSLGHGLTCQQQTSTSTPHYSVMVPILTRTLTDVAGTARVWKYDTTQAANETVVTDPSLNDTVYLFYIISTSNVVTKDFHETQRQIYQGAHNGQQPLETILTCYNANMTNCANASSSSGVSPVIQKDMFTTLSGMTQSAQSETKYNSLGNLLEDKEYDYSGAVLSDRVLKYGSYSNGSCSVIGISDRVCSDTTSDGAGNVYAQTNNTYDVYGNRTQVSSLVSGSTYLASSSIYNPNGTVSQSLDPKLNQTTFTYGDCNGTMLTLVQEPMGLSKSSTWNCTGGAPLTTTAENGQVTQYKYANAAGVADPYWRLMEVDYPDQGQTNATYNDSASPPNLVMSQLINASLTMSTQTNFDGFGHSTQTALNSDPQGVTYSVKVYDPLERIGTSYNATRCSPPTTQCSETTWGATSYSYDAMGRPILVTEPDGSKITTGYSGNCMAISDEAGNARKSCTDALGRSTGVWEDPGTSPHLNYETDYTYDPLGNLLTVTQKGGAGSGSWRTRSFQYDALSRLITASNPESGTISYSYLNASGGLCAGSPSAVCTKTAPSPNQPPAGTKTVVTTYAYDALNRLTGKSYGDGYSQNPATPSVSYGYGGVAPTGCVTTPPTLTDLYAGRERTSMCEASGATSWAHDPMGRILEEKRIIGTAPAKNIDYAYNFNGSLGLLQTPPLKTISYSYNRAGRATSVVDTGDSINFATGASYAAPGQLVGVTLGSGSAVPFTVSNAYNDRLQPILLSATTSTATVFGECYDFHLGVAVNTPPCSFSSSTAGDNGNVSQIVNLRDSTRTQNFTYDSLNRIGSGQSTGSGTYSWGEAFTIDAWSNLTNRAGISGKLNTEPLSQTATVQNQLSGFSFDKAGNMIGNGATSYMYDGENRLIWTNASGANAYVYDGDGKRVEKCVPTPLTATNCTGTTSGTLYWRGTGADTLDESDLSGNATEEYIFFNGQRIARRDVSNNHIHYYFSDDLGSHAVIQSGTTCEQDIDYYPYGGVEHDYCPGVAQNYKFTGKERDAESGLDNFGARYDASSLGRFMTPDWAAKPTAVPYAHYGNPQSLNLYSYVNNNPTTFGDPDGHEVDLTGTDKDKLAEQQRLAANASKTDKNGVKESSLFKQTTDKNGKTTLTVDKKAAAAYEGQHSAGYNLLTGAIDAKPTITVQMSNFDSYTSAADTKGNVTVNLNRNESQIDIISPLRGFNGEKIPNPFNIIAGHEVLGHAYPKIGGWDSSEKNAREVENELRQEQGLPLRDPNSN